MRPNPMPRNLYSGDEASRRRQEILKGELRPSNRRQKLFWLILLLVIIVVIALIVIFGHGSAL